MPEAKWATEPVMRTFEALLREGVGNAGIASALWRDHQIVVTPGQVAGKAFKLGKTIGVKRLVRETPTRVASSSHDLMMKLCPNGKPPWNTPAAIEIIHKARATHYTYATICAFFGVPDGTLRSALQRAGRLPCLDVEVDDERLKEHASVRWPLSKLLLLRDRHLAGDSYSDIARHVKMSRHAARSKLGALIDAGVMPRPAIVKAKIAREKPVATNPEPIVAMRVIPPRPPLRHASGHTSAIRFGSIGDYIHKIKAPPPGRCAWPLGNCRNPTKGHLCDAHRLKIDTFNKQDKRI
jgi:hypothetical protein